MTSTSTMPLGAPAARSRATRRPASSAACSHSRVSRSRPAIARAAPASARDVGLFDGLELETDARGIERVRLREDGWNAWTWRGHACNYISAGEGNDGPIVTLVHGFGAQLSLEVHDSSLGARGISRVRAVHVGIRMVSEG